MKKALKFTGLAVAVLVLGVAALISYVKLALPKVKPADQTLKIEVTAARVARGRYLAEHVAACMGCHSQRDWQTFGHPLIAGTEGAGGDPIFEKPLMPGSVQPKNLTPYHLGSWIDGEIVRAVRSGVSKDGRPLFPFMPYPSFREMPQEDLYSVIAYLRTLKPVKNDVAPTKLDPPLNIIVHTIPDDAPAYPAPVDPKDTVAYGGYLVKIGGCADCHTPVDDKHNPIKGMDFAGGQEFRYIHPKAGGGYEAHPGGGVLRVPNISFDPDSGIGTWTKAQFIAKFADWRGKKGDAKARKVDLEKGDYLPIMPYREYAGMTDADLGAIYDYLKAQPPVKNAVVRFVPPKS